MLLFSPYMEMRQYIYVTFMSICEYYIFQIYFYLSYISPKLLPKGNASVKFAAANTEKVGKEAY